MLFTIYLSKVVKVTNLTQTMDIQMQLPRLTCAQLQQQKQHVMGWKKHPHLLHNHRAPGTTHTALMASLRYTAAMDRKGYLQPCTHSLSGQAIRSLAAVSAALLADILLHPMRHAMLLLARSSSLSASVAHAGQRDTQLLLLQLGQGALLHHGQLQCLQDAARLPCLGCGTSSVMPCAEGSSPLASSCRQ